MLKFVCFQSFIVRRTGPRTGAQNCRSRLHKFKAFIQKFAYIPPNIPGKTSKILLFTLDPLEICHFECQEKFYKSKIIDNKICCAGLIFDPIFAKNSTPTSSIFLDLVEAVGNLFMKPQTSTVTKLVNLGIKLEVI